MWDLSEWIYTTAPDFINSSQLTQSSRVEKQIADFPWIPTSTYTLPWKWFAVKLFQDFQDCPASTAQRCTRHAMYVYAHTQKQSPAHLFRIPLRSLQHQSSLQGLGCQTQFEGASRRPAGDRLLDRGLHQVLRNDKAWRHCLPAYPKYLPRLPLWCLSWNPFSYSQNGESLYKHGSWASAYNALELSKADPLENHHLPVRSLSPLRLHEPQPLPRPISKFPERQTSALRHHAQDGRTCADQPGRVQSLKPFQRKSCQIFKKGLILLFRRVSNSQISDLPFSISTVRATGTKEEREEAWVSLGSSSFSITTGTLRVPN